MTTGSFTCSRQMLHSNRVSSDGLARPATAPPVVAAPPDAEAPPPLLAVAPAAGTELSGDASARAAPGSLGPVEEGVAPDSSGSEGDC